MARKRSSKPTVEEGIQTCPSCGGDYLRRVPRLGFKQKVLLPFFVFYPWECGQCKEPLLLRKRRKRKQSPEPDHAPKHAH